MGRKIKGKSWKMPQSIKLKGTQIFGLLIDPLLAYSLDYNSFNTTHMKQTLLYTSKLCCMSRFSIFHSLLSHSLSYGWFIAPLKLQCLWVAPYQQRWVPANSDLRWDNPWWQGVLEGAATSLICNGSKTVEFLKIQCSRGHVMDQKHHS